MGSLYSDKVNYDATQSDEKHRGVGKWIKGWCFCQAEQQLKSALFKNWP